MSPPLGLKAVECTSTVGTEYTLLGRIKLIHQLSNHLDSLVRHRHERAMRRIHLLNVPLDARSIGEHFLHKQWQRVVLQAPNIGATTVVALLGPANVGGDAVLAAESFDGVALEHLCRFGSQVCVAVVVESVGLVLCVDQSTFFL